MSNRRIIKQRLRKKFNSFLKSIKDEEVGKLVKDNTIITGGCIASMYLNEPVHDFDIYFTNKETAEAVAQYYVKQFIKEHDNCKIKPVVVVGGALVGDDRIRILIRSAGIVGDETKDKKYQYFESRPLEEGAEYVDEATAEMNADVALADVADETLIPLEGIGKKSKEKKDLYHPVFLTSNAITLSNKVQVVIRFYGDAEEVHKNFDYAHVMNWWDSKTGDLHIKLKTIESLLTKQLQYDGSLYPVCSLVRMRKFMKRGWHINAGQILKMAFQISQLDLTDLTVLQEQLMGVDAAYFSQLIKFCQEEQGKDEEFKLTMPYLAEIIDRIF